MRAQNNLLFQVYVVMNTKNYYVDFVDKMSVQDTFSGDLNYFQALFSYDILKRRLDIPGRKRKMSEDEAH